MRLIHVRTSGGRYRKIWHRSDTDPIPVSIADINNDTYGAFTLLHPFLWIIN